MYYVNYNGGKIVENWITDDRPSRLRPDLWLRKFYEIAILSQISESIP